MAQWFFLNLFVKDGLDDGIRNDDWLVCWDVLIECTMGELAWSGCFDAMTERLMNEVQTNIRFHVLESPY